jgi:hypothetical protein
MIKQTKSKIVTNKGTKHVRLNTNSKPGGHKEDWVSFPDQSQYMNSKIHTHNPTLEKRKGGEEEERGRAPERDLCVVLSKPGKKERESGEREIFIPH